MLLAYWRISFTKKLLTNPNLTLIISLGFFVVPFRGVLNKKDLDKTLPNQLLLQKYHVAG